MNVPGARFAGKRVLVTGAAAGIGRAISEGFLEEGAWVALSDLRAESLAAAADELAEYERAILLPCDVRDGEAVLGLVHSVTEAWGGIDVLVSNAGIYPNSPVLDMTEEEWDRVLSTNLRGAFLVCKAVAAVMAESATRGRIITITSGAQDVTRIGSAHYAASKAGLAMFTRTLALELAEYGINVNAVAPGFTEVASEMSPLTEEYKRAIVATIPKGRAARPIDIARAVLFMASEDAEFITGTTLKVDGGRSAGSYSLPQSQ